MKNSLKYGAGIWIFAGCCDRFTPSYSKSLNTGEMIDAAAAVKGLKGLELIYPWNFEGKKPSDLKKQIEDKGIEIISVNPNIWGDMKFKYGALSSPDPKVRRDAADLMKKTIDVCGEVGCNRSLLWPGQDGFDYPMQANYKDIWNWQVEGLREVASYNKDTKISVEYKLKEPRMHILAASAAAVLALAQDAGVPNIGATLDFGHSLLARENPAQTAVLLDQHDKLFNVHMNDASGEWDDDLLVGSVHMLETVEFLYYLQNEINYDGWLSVDITPYREDAIRACQQCIDAMGRFAKAANSLDMAKLKEFQAKMDAVGVVELVHEALRA